MKKFNSYILLIIAAVLSLQLNSKLLAQNENGGFKLPAFEKYTLPNGLTVYLMEQHEVPLIYFSAALPGGAVYDSDKSGLASLTADGLMFGTKSYTKNQIEETIDFYGASLGTYAGNESARISASFAAGNKDKIMPVIKEVLVDPVFNKEEFEKRKQMTLVELKQAKESPRSVINSYFNKFLYNNNVYGNPVSGSVASVSKLTAEDLKEFYNTHYIPSGSVIAIAGDFKTSEMKKMINNLFGSWKGKSSKAPAVSFSAPGGFTKSRVLLINKDDATETTFFIGSYGIKQSNPDYVAVQVINTILGGRFTSWLNDELRVNSGLTYGARSSFNAMKETGTFSIYTYTRNATTVQAIDLALKVLDRLHSQGIDENILASAKNYIKGQYPPKYETAGQLSELLVNMYVYGFDESYINNFTRNVDNFTLSKAKEIIAKYFPKDNLQFVVIGKASEIKDKVSKYGEVTVKEIQEDGF